ncbi:MAG: hypothetical protein FWD57_02165 [Polyangiaceae bacterium]|nr:hypothetical protein [Polyangiaceae bacterium]
MALRTASTSPGSKVPFEVFFGDVGSVVGRASCGMMGPLSRLEARYLTLYLVSPTNWGSCATLFSPTLSWASRFIDLFSRSLISARWGCGGCVELWSGLG